MAINTYKVPETLQDATQDTRTCKVYKILQGFNITISCCK